MIAVPRSLVPFADGLNPGGTAPAGPRWGGMDEDTLLIVEEDILIRHPLAEYLRDCGFKVVEASGTADARVLIGDDAFHRVEEHLDRVEIAVR